MIECPCCESHSCTNFLHLDRLPLIIFPVDESKKDEIPFEPISTFECAACSHVFRLPLSDDHQRQIYEELYHYYPYDKLESLSRVYREPFESFFSDLLQAERSRGWTTLLEIGCASSEQLEFFTRLGLQCSAIDPRPVDMLENSVIARGYYEDYQFAVPFDIIASRFNLEHLNNLSSFFQKVSNDLSARGVVVIQVPNIESFISHNTPLFVAHEHVHYFSVESLTKVADRHGFVPRAVGSPDAPSILMAFEKRAEAVNGSSLQNSFAGPTTRADYKKRVSEMAVTVEQILASRSSVCFYGAGLGMVWLLYGIGYRPTARDVLIDDNPAVTGRYLPETNIPIRAYSASLINSYSTVLLTLNPIYHDVVRRRLAESGFRNEVIAIGNSLT